MKNRSFSLSGTQLNLGILLFKILLAFIFIHASGEKLTGGGVPNWFTKQFASTVIASLPGGVNGGFYAIALLEALSGLSLLLSIAFPPWTGTALLLSEMTFFALGAGLRISHQFADAASLFMYFGVTLILHFMITQHDQARAT